MPSLALSNLKTHTTTYFNGYYQNSAMMCCATLKMHQHTSNLHSVKLETAAEERSASQFFWTSRHREPLWKVKLVYDCNDTINATLYSNV